MEFVSRDQIFDLQVDLISPNQIFWFEISKWNIRSVDQITISRSNIRFAVRIVRWNLQIELRFVGQISISRSNIRFADWSSISRLHFGSAGWIIDRETVIQCADRIFDLEILMCLVLLSRETNSMFRFKIRSRDTNSIYDTLWALVKSANASDEVSVSPNEHKGRLDTYLTPSPLSYFDKT